MPDGIADPECDWGQRPTFVDAACIPDHVMSVRKVVIMAIGDRVLLGTGRNSHVEGQTVGFRCSPTVAAGIVAGAGAATQEDASAAADILHRDRGERPVALLDRINVLNKAVGAALQHDTIPGRAVIV